MAVLLQPVQLENGRFPVTVTAAAWSFRGRKRDLSLFPIFQSVQWNLAIGPIWFRDGISPVRSERDFGVRATTDRESGNWERRDAPSAGASASGVLQHLSSRRARHHRLLAAGLRRRGRAILPRPLYARRAKPLRSAHLVRWKDLAGARARRCRHRGRRDRA